MIKRAKHFLRRQLLRSSCYRWYVFTPRISRETISPLLARYGFHAAGGPFRQHHTDGTTSPLSDEQKRRFKALNKRRIVYICDGQTLAGGLADRFKGIISLYAICKRLGYDFRIHYTSPFRLEEYLAPADYDWTISPEALNYKDAAIVVLENTEDSDYQTRKQAQWLTRRLQQGPEEIHVITNSNFAYQLDYAALFAELFCPTPKLQQALDAERQALGRYISVSARFLSMLGDFRETGANSSLPNDEAERLIDACIEQIERLHEAHPGLNILVGSDSKRFLNRAGALPYTYVVKGDVAHTDLMGSDDAERLHTKLFLDFLLISGAEKVCLLQTGLMRISGFPYAASRISNAPFSIIKF